jgi:hypothetical protein
MLNQSPVNPIGDLNSKIRMTNGEILCSVIEGHPVVEPARGHSPTHAPRFFEHSHFVPRLDESTCGGQPGHTGPYDSDFQDLGPFFGPSSFWPNDTRQYKSPNNGHSELTAPLRWL